MALTDNDILDSIFDPEMPKGGPKQELNQEVPESVLSDEEKRLQAKVS